MRLTTSILILLCGTTAVATAAETWRWVDRDGVVHYSDQPGPGAERFELQAAPNPGSVAPPSAGPRVPSSQPAQPTGYRSCQISSPQADQVFFDVNAVSAAVNLQPPLLPDHRVTVRVDGRPVSDWPATATGYQLSDLPRGSHTVQAVILDAAGRVACTTPGLTFHVRQRSLLSPGADAARQRSGVATPATVPRAAPAGR